MSLNIIEMITDRHNNYDIVRRDRIWTNADNSEIRDLTFVVRRHATTATYFMKFFKSRVEACKWMRAQK